jgi:hypothetical protein
MIAISLGRASGDVPAEARTWSRIHGDSWTAADVRLAVRAVERVAADSDLRDFWDEVDDTEEWLQEANELAARLSRLVDAH